MGYMIYAVYPKYEQCTAIHFSRGGNKTLLPWVTRKATNKPKELNKLKIVKMNNMVQLFINDSPAGESPVVASSNDTYEVGIYSGGADNKATAIFDNFVVTVL